MLLPLSKFDSGSKTRPKKRRRAPVSPREPKRKSRRLAGQKAPDYYTENVILEGRNEHLAGKVAADGVEEETQQRGLDFMPLSVDDLIPEERKAYASLRKARNARAREFGVEAYKVVVVRVTVFALSP